MWNAKRKTHLRYFRVWFDEDALVGGRSVPGAMGPDRIWSVTLVRLMIDMRTVSVGRYRFFEIQEARAREHAPKIVTREKAIPSTMIGLYVRRAPHTQVHPWRSKVDLLHRILILNDNKCDLTLIAGIISRQWRKGTIIEIRTVW